MDPAVVLKSMAQLGAVGTRDPEPGPEVTRTSCPAKLPRADLTLYSYRPGNVPLSRVSCPCALLWHLLGFIAETFKVKGGVAWPALSLRTATFEGKGGTLEKGLR